MREVEKKKILDESSDILLSRYEAKKSGFRRAQNTYEIDSKVHWKRKNT